MCEIVNFRVKILAIAAKCREAWRGLIVAVVPCITTSLPIPWVCTSHTFLIWLILWPDVESLSSLALLPRICWPPRELDTEGWHLQQERPSRTSITTFEGLDFSEPAESCLYQNLV